MNNKKRPPLSHLYSIVKRLKANQTGGYWFSQEDLVTIARTVYGWTNGLEQRLHFEVIGSVQQLRNEINRNIAGLEAGRRLTLIVNIDRSHWTSLVIARHPQSGDFHAFYADSFGIRPNTISAHEDISSQNAILSFQALKNIVINTQTEILREIQFRDLSLRQQSDPNSCGIFALENSRLINDFLTESQHWDDIGARLQSERIDIDTLRQEFNRIINPPIAANNEEDNDIQNEEQLIEQLIENDDGDFKKEMEIRDEDNDMQNDNEEQPLENDDDDNDDFEEEMEMDHLEEQWKLFTERPTAQHFMDFVLSVSQSRDSDDVNIDRINVVLGLQRLVFLDTVPQALFTVSQGLFHALYEIVGQARDPLDSLDPKLNTLIEEMSKQAIKIFGADNLMTFKAMLMKIYFSNDSFEEAKDFLDTYPSYRKDLKEKFENLPFAEAVGDVRLDVTEIHDVLRFLRNLYSMSLLLRANGQFEESERALESAISRFPHAEVNMDFIAQRPNGSHMRDLIFLIGHVLRARAQQLLQKGEIVAAATAMTRSFTGELTYRGNLGLPPAYVNFINFMLRNSAFYQTDLFEFWERNVIGLDLVVPHKFFNVVSIALRLRAQQLSLKEASKVKGILNFGLHYALRILSNQQEGENYHIGIVEREWYNILLERHQHEISNAQNNNDRSRIHLDYIEDVLEQDLDVMGQEYAQIVGEFIGILERLRVSDPQFVVSLIGNFVERLKEDWKNSLNVEEVGAPCLRILAESYLRFGRVDKFILHSFQAACLAIEHGRTEEVQQTYIDTLIQTLVDIEPSVTTVDNQDLLYQITETLRIWSQITNPNSMESLHSLSTRAVLENQNRYLTTLEVILQSSEVRLTLDKIASDYRVVS